MSSAERLESIEKHNSGKERLPKTIQPGKDRRDSHSFHFFKRSWNCVVVSLRSGRTQPLLAELFLLHTDYEHIEVLRMLLNNLPALMGLHGGSHTLYLK